MPNRPVPLWYVLIAIVVGPVLGVLLTWGYIVKASGHQQLATCAVVAANRAEKRAQLQAYEETPPTTAAGFNIRDTMVESLRTWDALWTSLKCKE